MSSNKPTSMQGQSPLSEAQDSVAKATRAVHQAQSHPTNTTVQQAENALSKAQNAVSQAQRTLNQKALEETESQLSAIQADLPNSPPS